MSLISTSRLAFKGTRAAIVPVRMYAAGSGVGKGGGGGGTIRAAGGSLGKMGAAQEEQYFRKKQREQLKELKTYLDSEIEFHKAAIKRHQDAIQRHEGTITGMDKKEQE